MCDEMQSTRGSFSTAVQNLSAHTLMNVSHLPKGYLAAQAADTTNVISDYYIQSGSSLKKPEAYILYYFSSVSFYYIKFM
jgi:hypothetical protein